MGAEQALELLGGDEPEPAGKDSGGTADHEGSADLQPVWGGSPSAMVRRIRVLEQAPLFYTLPERTLRLLARQAQEARFEPGSQIAVQGDPGDSLIVVMAGRCEVRMDTPEGQEVVAVLSPGDTAGEVACLLEKPQPATLRALEPVRVLALDRIALHDILGSHSEAAEGLHQLALQRASAFAAAAERRPAVGTGSVIAVYSPKGGTGSTTLALSLAAALAERTPRGVVLLDMALPYPQAALLANLIPAGSLARAAGLEGSALEAAVMGATLVHPNGMLVLPAALRAAEAESVSAALAADAIRILAGRLGYVVVDLGVAMSDVTLSVLDHSDRVVVVVEGELASVQAAAEALDILITAVNLTHGQITLALNRRTPKATLGADAVARAVGRSPDVEIGYDGDRPGRDALAGRLTWQDRRSQIHAGVQRLLPLVAPQNRVRS